MEEAVVGAVVGASIQILLQNLLSISVEEINLFRGFGKELKRLQDSFLMIQDFLYDAEMQQVTNKAVNRWLKKLEAVAYEADNVLDDLNYEVLSRKMEKPDKMKQKVHAFFSRSNPVAFRRKMATKIKSINDELERINQEATGFGLQMRFVGAHAPTPAVDGRETDSYNADPVVLGREDDVSAIVDMLISSPAEQVLSVLPIVGMGGLGKTTLARQVYNNEMIKAHFEERIWVYVSQNFDATTLFKKIVESLTGQSIEHGSSREVLLQKIQQNLEAKKYLLVLDDVWNEVMEKWDDFINSLLGISSLRGHGIIVTTRSDKVSSIVKTVPVHKLKSLSEDICWSIIKAKAFREGDIPPEFETIRKRIAKRCQGLPLAAKVMGGMLLDKSENEWLSIEDTWLSNFGGDGSTVSKILKLSFDHLSPPSLKKCFAFCSIFPKGLEMRREYVIDLWMADGFLQADQGNDMETMGNKFFNLLLQNSLLQVVNRDDYGNIISCNMHDLVHDLARSVLGSKSICASDNASDEIHQARYMSLKSIGDESCAISKEEAKYVRLLLFEGKVFHDMLLDFKSLRVLILKGEDVEELPISIGKLIHLRFVDISYTRIEYLPDPIGNLYYLQTLIVDEAYCKKLPNTLKHLVSLRHLHIPNIELPLGIGKLTSLQTLPYFQVGHERGRTIIELGSLKNLKGTLEIHNLEKVCDKEDAKSAHLFQKPNIFKLKFAWSELREGEINDEDVLEGLQPHPDLKSLEIEGFKGRNFPLWILKMVVHDDLEGRWIGLNHLREISLTHCKECDEIPMLGHLPHLKRLYLHDLPNVRSIDSSFYGIGSYSTPSRTSKGVQRETITLFPVLERLELSKMPNLTEWVEAELPPAAESVLRELIVFPCLEYLKITECRQLSSTPGHFPYLKKLKISDMDSALPLANICGIKLISLTELKIDKVDGLVSLPDWLFYNNQNISYLRIRDCPNLMHLVLCLGGGRASLRRFQIWNCSNLRVLPNDFWSLSSLELLCIWNCPNLRSIPYPSGEQTQGFTNLYTLQVSSCEALTSLPSEMIASCAASLKMLLLNRLNSLTNFAEVISHLPRMSRLTYLGIGDVPKFTYLPMEIGSLGNLYHLTVLPFSDSSDLASYKEFLDVLFRELKSLRTLWLFGHEHWDSLPDRLQNLTSVSELAIHRFGIELFPEWFGKLSGLKILILRSCKKLKSLPSVTTIQRLVIEIEDCPLLEQI
ncbi:putative disease resistance protein RGA3 [Sesamum indicum]|uniref:Disease resistance protein RGA3 n=1 Tax=Sesamum indicum TaxID=4182 RepID=A0A6I9TWG1_SESIN|nr:putative disease resistance protein RGA3 [Sesamum indicum]